MFRKNALIGATDIIHRNKPKLAIRAYHKAKHIYKLPYTILSIRCYYKFLKKIWNRLIKLLDERLFYLFDIIYYRGGI